MVHNPALRPTGRRLVALAAVGLLALTGCGGSGGGSGGGDKSKVTVTYQQFGGSHVQDQFLGGVKAEFEKANPGITVKLQPITASENDYYTKLAAADALAADRRRTWSTRTRS